MGNVNSILDIACGLNPVAYVLSDNFDSRVRYEATDINLDNIELVNKILSLYDLQAKIYGSDILCDIPNGEWDVVFLFKIVPLLEQQKKGYFRSIIEQINYKLNMKFNLLTDEIWERRRRWIQERKKVWQRLYVFFLYL